MAFFAKTLNSQLYVAPSTDNDKGFAAFLLPAPPASPADGYDISQALTDVTLGGTFILSAYNPLMDTEQQTTELVNQLMQMMNQGRFIYWIADFNDLSAANNTMFVGIDGDGATINSGTTISLITGISLQIPSGITLTAADNAITVGSNDNNGPKITFVGSQAPMYSAATMGSFPLSGGYRGCLSFAMDIDRQSLSKGFSWGFQMLLPLVGDVNQTAVPEYYALAQDSDPDMLHAIGFNITIDPTDVFNLAYDIVNQPGVTISKQYNSRRTVFAFTGQNRDQSQTIITSNYFTTRGQNIQFIPSQSNNNGLQARLVFNQGEQYTNEQRGHLAPEGDFVFLIADATSGATYPLQCGLQGTEFFNVQSQANGNSGDYIRFISNQPAYAPVYPLPLSSPVTAPVDVDAPLLDTIYRTSWCTIVNAATNAVPSYVAQPKGSALYGASIGSNLPKLIGHSTPNFSYTANDVVLFPMLPYTVLSANSNSGKSFTISQIEDFEKLFVSSIRKKNINGILIQSQKNARANLLKAGVNADTATTVSTPSGLIAGLSSANNSNPVWNAIYLAQNQPKPGADFTKMYFSNPDDALVQAFQTSDLFLVIANDLNIGAAVNDSAADNDIAQFFNNMFIGDWTMQANTGTQNRYNDYNNIIIVKGTKGKLYDPNDSGNSLIANWQKWTARDTFASPATLDSEGNLSEPDPSQLVILSQWMQSYFEDAANQTDTAYFGNFNAIAQDPNWTGILILGMNISGLPTNLNGILSGVRYPALFRAHHFGINITPVKQGDNGPVVNTSSSLFGLIYYNDPDFIAAQDPQPIEPNLTNTYDFVLLNLKVLFENTAVSSFQSYAQLTTNNYFGSSVDHMGAGGNTFNTMILKGALQFKGAEAIYSLGTNSVNTFYFNSPVVNKIEISNASFSTVGTDEKGMLVSRFSISGFWDFKKLMMPSDPDATTVSNDQSPLTDDPTPPKYFDVFSFGNDGTDDNLRKGLIFNNLIIQMVSPQYVPGSTEPLDKVMTFDTSVMTFDQARSTPRPDSIYVNFALNLQNIVQGTKDTTPSGKDYLTVITDLKVGSIEGTPWVGLSYQLNMGTPGALAGNVGLTSTLLTAWDPTANDEENAAPPISVGIKLPGTGGGAKLISLQSVLKLSIGQIRLAVDYTTPDKPAFLMMFTEIALKFLGLLKIPPNGSSLFYLFGNPQSDGKASGLGWYAMYKKDANAEKEAV
jgi:hypothetical protein